MNFPLYIDVSCRQNNCNNERVCGDVYLAKHFKEEGRTIIVLADGMGHGVKANMLAILTASMAMNFTREHKETNRIAEVILNTLPIDSEKKTAFSTFSIVDIEPTGNVTILEYENPQCLILRNNEIYYPEWTCLLLNLKRPFVGRELKTCTFYAQRNDRIILFTDGVSQAGLGSKAYPMGWTTDQVHQYVHDIVQNQPNIDASSLAFKIIYEAYKKDGFESKDDTSCAVIYFREPRRLIICTGPPTKPEYDKEIAQRIDLFIGKKIICGGTTGEIIARELNLKINNTPIQTDPDLPPMYQMEGIDLYTEGILTLNRVNNILQKYSPNYQIKNSPADQIVELLLESDDIQFIVGTAINEAHQDPSIPIELEIRRTLIRRIVKILEEKFLKKVKVDFY